MPGRSYTSGSSSYRYGFQTQEKSSEINESSYTAEFWQYDSRIGRRWNVDPVTKDYESPYAAFGNNPILHIDPNGADTTKPSTRGLAWQNGSGNVIYGPLSPEYAASQGLSPVQSQPNNATSLPEVQMGQGSWSWNEPWQKKPRHIVSDGGPFETTINGQSMTVTVGAVTEEFGIGDAEGMSSAIPGYGSGRNSINAFQNGQYVKGTLMGIMAITDLIPFKAAVGGLSKTVTITGYHATESAVANSIVENGLRFSKGGRVGAAKYISNTPETALSELLYHRPALSNVTIVELQYQIKKPLLNLTSLPKVSYKLGNNAFLKADAGAIMFNSLRGNGVNYAIKEGNYIGGTIYFKF